MITIETIADKAGLTRNAVMYRIKELEKHSSTRLSLNYQKGKVGAIRVYTEKDMQAVLNYQPRKPGRKRHDQNTA